MKKKRSKDEIIICYNNKNSNIDIDSNYVKKEVTVVTLVP